MNQQTNKPTELKSFTISQTQNKSVRNPQKKEEEITEAFSVGFPRIEAQVENDGPIIESMKERLEILLKQSKTSLKMKDKAAAKKAAEAYQHSISLIEHLLATKASMTE